MYITPHKKSCCINYNLMEKNTKHKFRRLCRCISIPCLLMIHKVTVYDLVLCRHT